jgi:hypothetical protein
MLVTAAALMHQATAVHSTRFVAACWNGGLDDAEVENCQVFPAESVTEVSPAAPVELLNR